MKNKMKSIMAVLLVLTALLLTACGGGNSSSDDEIDVYEAALNYEKNSNQAVVYTPLSERPNYALEEGASIEEMRDMAVKVMYDELSFLWTPLTSFTYTKTGAGADGVYYFGSDTVFAGMPYTNAGGSLFHMLDYYDYKNGVIFGLEGKDANEVIGNNCAPAVNWGLAAVCTNISASDTGSMSEKNGFVAVGGYDISGIDRFNAQIPTVEICNREGPQKMYSYYAQLVKADAVMTTPTGSHAMMVLEPADVVYNEDGTIDPLKSSIIIQDQRFGEKDITLNGQTASYRGRFDAKVTFESLYQDAYIPLRAAQLADENYKFVAPKGELRTTGNTYADLKKAKVLSNFRVVKIEGKLVSDSGKTVLLKRANSIIQDYYDGTDRSMDVNRILPKEAEASDVMKSGHTYHYQISVLFANGVEQQLFDQEVKASFFK